MDESDSLLLCLEGDVMRGSKIAKEIEDDLKREKAIKNMIEREKKMKLERDKKKVGEVNGK